MKKLGKLERITIIIGVIIVLVIGTSTYITMNAFEKHGGVRQFIIDAGKEARDIGREIGSN